jgi:hypothetical protein
MGDIIMSALCCALSLVIYLTCLTGLANFFCLACASGVKDQLSSIAMAVASPPPIHKEATPRLRPRAFNA